MRKVLTTSVVKLSSLFQISEEYNISRVTLLQRAGIDPLVLNSPDNRLSLHQVHQLTQMAVAITGDDYLGLHQGEKFAGFSNILGYVLMNCKNLRQALNKLIQYQKICDEGTAIELNVQNDTALLQISILDSMLEKERHLSDYRLSGIYTYMKKLTGVSFKLMKVCLCHNSPSQVSEYERIFRCPVIFNSSMNTICFEQKYLDLPILEPNRELLKTFEQYARQVLGKINTNDSYYSKVGKIVITLLQGESPSIETVAGKLAMSVRNLQLKLQGERTTYSRILNDIRKELALGYLNDSKTSIMEITYLLGYSEVSVFYRAFKKWTNTTPIRFRRNISDTL